ncbi:type VI secretion system baseplate subunit TssE [Stigmatella sp. ncwal1]|uniref:Type VI secretion system baseplate subunit TssE n=1 Tax=Stigmatella ashevillensis TaxID=2995309 RepID=A0ABT5DDN6_9BACT|nr:type VI secretion system baseplate subunit TssE [Stigmatella ashevillena]MDC0711159.1 type VI secretion system baseplate subunit TssE [Stigmatella ashevillena]
MSTRGLLSRLEKGGGHLSSQREHPTESITAHLRVLLNTRKGESVSSPAYGILDFNDVVHAFPSAIQKMQSSIRMAIQEYEPRLKNVTVVHTPDVGEPSALKFEITAQLAQKGSQGLLRFRTRVGAGGQIDLW